MQHTFSKYILHITVTFLMLLSSFLGAESFQYENMVVERIDIQIVNQPGSCADSNAIMARIKTRAGDFFSQSDFDSDLKRLVAEFDRVDPFVEMVNDKLHIILKIWPRPLIRTITWVGNCKVQTSALVGELGIATSSLFDRCAFNQAFHKIKAYYVSRGYFEAQLSYEIAPSPLDPCQVDIQINIDEGRAGRIQKILFVNFTTEEKHEILEQIATRKYNIFLSWLTDEGTYREDMVRQDELIILNYLQNQGFADARVRIVVCETPRSDRIILKVIADRGEYYRFGSLTVSGNTLFCDDEIRDRFIRAEGTKFSPEIMRDIVSSISNLYGKYGYIDTVVDFEPCLVEGENVYNVEFKIIEGEQYHVGMIKVFGNYWTQNNVILNECLLIPGSVFNLEKLKATESRLTNIGYFKNVNVYAVKSEDANVLGENYRDVNIEIEETSTGHIGASFGYSTEESVFGGINITENNFNSAGLAYFLTDGFKGLRGGGEYAHFGITIGNKSRSYLFSWSKPYFMDSKWTVGFDIERSSNRYVSKNYDIETTGFTLKGLYPVNQFVRFGTHYRIKHTDFDINVCEAPRKLKREVRNSGLISAAGFTWVYDSTNGVRPTKGFKSRFEAEFAGLGGKHKFLKFAYVNNYYFRILPWDVKGVWRIRADARFIQPLWNSDPEDIPIDERYFLGGDYTVRGYRPYRIGPQFDDDDPEGGISLQFLSLEYTRPLFQRVEIFFFVESGHLSLAHWDVTGRYYTSLGYGLKIHVFPNTPPVMLGMGYPMNAKDKSQVRRFFLTLGGNF